jgi:hypothetical protein
MNIEIIDFYPLHKDAHQYTGTIRLRIIDIGIDLLGVHAKRTKDKWYFNIPFKTGVDDKGNFVQYPLISFEDKEKQRALVNSIREKAPAFIEARIKDPVKPIVFKDKKAKKQIHKKPEIQHNCANDYKQNTQSKILKWTKADGLKKK